MTDDVTPFDLLDNKNHTTKSIRNARYDICKSCDKFTMTKQCSVCLCFMAVKTWLKGSYCPLHKWGAVDDEGKVFYGTD